MIKTSHYVEGTDSTVYDVKKLPYSRIGQVTGCAFRSLDLYIFLLDPDPIQARSAIQSTVYSELKNSIRRSKGLSNPTLLFTEVQVSATNSSESITLDLSCTDFFYSIEDLFVKTFEKNSPFFFVETFGNKTKTIIPSIDFGAIKEKIELTFNKPAHSWLVIDLCISSSFG